MDRTLAEFAASGDTVVRRGKLFSAGTYPDKSFSLTPEEMQAACREFRPVPIEDTHYPSIFDGRLGEIQSIEVDADGRTLRGAVALPRWLHEVFADEPLKVSCNWDRVTKRLKSVALVPNPRISDAALFAAFSAAPGQSDFADEGGQWITIHGTHVLISDQGEVKKGPETLHGFRRRDSGATGRQGAGTFQMKHDWGQPDRWQSTGEHHFQKVLHVSQDAADAYAGNPSGAVVAAYRPDLNVNEVHRKHGKKLGHSNAVHTGDWIAAHEAHARGFDAIDYDKNEFQDLRSFQPHPDYEKLTRGKRKASFSEADSDADEALFAQLAMGSEDEPRDEPAAEFDGPGGVHWVTINGAHVPLTDQDVGPEHVSQATSRLGIGHQGHTALHAALDAGKIETDAHLYGVIRAARGHEAQGKTEAEAYAAAVASHGQEGPSVRITGQGTIKARGMAPLTHQATADLVRLADAAQQGKEAVRGVREDIGDDRVREAAAHAQRLKTAGLLQKAVAAHKTWQDREERRSQDEAKRDLAREESKAGQGGRGLIQEAASQGYDVHLKDPATGRVHTYRTLPDNLKPSQYEEIFQQLNTSGRQNTSGGKEKLYPVPGGGKLQMHTLHSLVTGEKKLPPGAFRRSASFSILSFAEPEGLRLPAAWSEGAGFSLARLGRKGNTMSAPRWWGKLAALFTDAGADPEKIKEIEAEFSADDGKTPDPKAAATGADPRDERIKTLEAQFTSERQARLRSEAAAFAKEVIQVQKKALPAEFAALQQQYLDAATDDAAGPREVTFGQDQKGSRTDALRAAVALRPAHQLTEELAGQQLAALFSGAADEKEKPVTIDPEKIYAKLKADHANGGRKA